MTFRDQAETTTEAVVQALGATPSAEQRKTVAGLIEQSIIDSYQDAAERCATVAMDCCSEDRDMAYKIAKEIKRQNTALIANLSALR